jgi:hypothetical protein
MTGGRLPTGYEVPLPPGSYRVELRARDGDERAALAALGPTVEGQAVTAAAGVSPGSARREDRVSTLRIEDGFLDLQWAQDRGRPAAFEVVILKLD